jgi:hypothetical protein
LDKYDVWQEVVEGPSMMKIVMSPRITKDLSLRPHSHLNKIVRMQSGADG